MNINEAIAIVRGEAAFCRSTGTGDVSGYGAWLLRKADAQGMLLAEVERLTAILRDVPSLHQRKCHDCGKIHWHADNITPYVLCPECKSQDTRRVSP